MGSSRSLRRLKRRFFPRDEHEGMGIASPDITCEEPYAGKKQSSNSHRLEDASEFKVERFLLKALPNPPDRTSGISGQRGYVVGEKSLKCFAEGLSRKLYATAGAVVTGRRKVGIQILE